MTQIEEKSSSIEQLRLGRGRRDPRVGRVKFMLSLTEPQYEALRDIGQGRGGLTVQEVLRSIVIPNYFLEHVKREKRE